MNSNERITKFKMVDKQFKLRQLSAKRRKTVKKTSSKINRLKVISQDTKRAA